MDVVHHFFRAGDPQQFIIQNYKTTYKVNVLSVNGNVGLLKPVISLEMSCFSYPRSGNILSKGFISVEDAPWVLFILCLFSRLRYFYALSIARANQEQCSRTS